MLLEGKPETSMSVTILVGSNMGSVKLFAFLHLEMAWLHIPKGHEDNSQVPTQLFFIWLETFKTNKLCKSAEKVEIKDFTYFSILQSEHLKYVNSNISIFKSFFFFFWQYQWCLWQEPLQESLFSPPVDNFVSSAEWGFFPTGVPSSVISILLSSVRDYGSWVS